MFSRNTYYKWIHILPTIIVPNCTKNLPWNTHRILNLVSRSFLHDQKYSGNNGFPQSSLFDCLFFLENFYLSKSSSALNPPSLPIHSTLRKNAFHPFHPNCIITAINMYLYKFEALGLRIRFQGCVVRLVFN